MFDSMLSGDCQEEVSIDAPPVIMIDCRQQKGFGIFFWRKQVCGIVAIVDAIFT